MGFTLVYQMTPEELIQNKTLEQYFVSKTYQFCPQIRSNSSQKRTCLVFSFLPEDCDKRTGPEINYGTDILTRPPLKHSGNSELFEAQKAVIDEIKESLRSPWLRM